MGRYMLVSLKSVTSYSFSLCVFVPTPQVSQQNFHRREKGDIARKPVQSRRSNEMCILFSFFPWSYRVLKFCELSSDSTQEFPSLFF